MKVKSERVMERVSLVSLVILVALVGISMVFILHPSAFSLTYDGDLDPDKIVGWEIVEGTQRVIAPGLSMMTLRNPDRGSEIQLVQVLFTYPAGDLMSYRYFKNGDIFEYTLNQTRDSYERYNYTERERNLCRECHEDKLNISKLNI